MMLLAGLLLGLGVGLALWGGTSENSPLWAFPAGFIIACTAYSWGYSL